MPPRARLLALLIIAGLASGCSSRESGRDRNERAFTLSDSADWGDAAGRVLNHVLGPAQPRGGIWPADER